jgi:DNA polymerase-3 subunit epsilon
MNIKIAFLDLETTGLDQEKGHRIIELAFLLYQYDTLTQNVKPIGKYIQRINPDRSIDAKAQAVHKISIDDLMGQPKWGAGIVNKIIKILDMCDLLVCHNVDFDGHFLASEITRLGFDIPYIETFCTMDNGRFATFDGFPPSLKKLCECFDVGYDQSKAHGAEYDIQLTAKCFFLGLKRGVYHLPKFDQIKEAV